MSRRGGVVEAPAALDGRGSWDPGPHPVDPSGRVGRGGWRAGRGPATRVAVLALVAGLLLTAGVVAVSRSGSTGAPDDGASPATATARVARQDLVARTEVDGNLGYAGEMRVVNRAQGTVTALPALGTVVERGQPLYSVGDRPVPLLYGDRPVWRRMAQDVDGADTLQLEQNLVAMGHATEAEMVVDGKFTGATTTAVKRWQKAMGVEQTGAVELGQAVFLPGAIRVAEVKAEIGAGAPPEGQVLSGTSTSRVVKIDLDATRQSLVKVGDKVEIELPSGPTTTGTVAEVGTVARTQGQDQGGPRVVSVTVTPDDPAATGSLDEAPVRVGITSDRRSGVLTVPVSALLALSEGGYGVRVVDGTGPGRIVAVTPGLFAGGRVEVSGDGLVEGADVEVPAS